jgi:hypothetical protein
MHPALPTGSDPSAPSDAAFCVWEHGPTGRRLHFFHDEFLAQRFAVSISSQVVANPTSS